MLFGFAGIPEGQIAFALFAIISAMVCTAFYTKFGVGFIKSVGIGVALGGFVIAFLYIRVWILDLWDSRSSRRRKPTTQPDGTTDEST